MGHNPRDYLNLRENQRRVGHPKHPLEPLLLTAAEYNE